MKEKGVITFICECGHERIMENSGVFNGTWLIRCSICNRWVRGS